MAKKKATPRKKNAVRKPAVKKKAAPKKKAAGRLSLTGNTPMTLSVEFHLGGGNLTAKLFRAQRLIQTLKWDTTQDKTFTNVISGDEISITGVCTNNASLFTDRDTTPASKKNSIHHYPEGPIFDNLGIN